MNTQPRHFSKQLTQFGEVQNPYYLIRAFFTAALNMALKMSWKKVIKTAEEAVEYLISEELESEMIALPPEVDELTDEGFDDTNS
ncbi:hypothetical protein TNCV_4390531 [Trichonephila clavipes]|nr:hypothetical protein TNCV_4390531 [Trichonephila clavipes]